MCCVYYRSVGGCTKGGKNFKNTSVILVRTTVCHVFNDVTELRISGGKVNIEYGNEKR